jgi:hypothetical protein
VPLGLLTCHMEIQKRVKPGHLVFCGSEPREACKSALPQKQFIS